MMYVLLGIVLVVVAFILREQLGDANVFVITVGVFCGLLASVMLILIHLQAIGIVVEIEQLRKQVQMLGEDSRTEDILGKVADVNMMLASCKRMNQVPTLGDFYPDKVCKLEEIAIPERIK